MINDLKLIELSIEDKLFAFREKFLDKAENHNSLILSEYLLHPLPSLDLALFKIREDDVIVLKKANIKPLKKAQSFSDSEIAYLISYQNHSYQFRVTNENVKLNFYEENSYKYFFEDEHFDENF